MDDAKFLRQALEEAQRSYAHRTGSTPGLPIGAVMVQDNAAEPFARGHNRRVQDDDPTAHGEMVCLRNGGRRRRYDDVTLYTTLSPCMMCAGTIVQFGIPRVVVGEAANFGGNVEFLRERGVEVLVLDDPDCKALMSEFIRKYPDVWDEDIAGRDAV